MKFIKFMKCVTLFTRRWSNSSLAMLMLLLSSAVTQAQHPVTWSVKASPVVNGETTLSFTATMQDDWHIYSPFMEEGGPLPTAFVFTGSKDFELIGTITEPSGPVVTYDSIMELKIIWFGKSAEFKQRIRLLSPYVTVKGVISFMACREDICLPPEEKPFSVEIKKQ